MKGRLTTRHMILIVLGATSAVLVYMVVSSMVEEQMISALERAAR